MIRKDDTIIHPSVFRLQELPASITAIIPNGSFRVLSFFSPTQYLVLAKTSYFQHIFLCSIESNTDNLLATFTIHKKVISASLSTNQDKLFVVFYSKPNCFSKSSYYTAECIIPNRDISYPISGPLFDFIPKIECFDINSKFIFSNEYKQYSIFDISCNETEFQIHQEQKSSIGVIWWGLKNKSQLESVKFDMKKEKYKFQSSQKTFFLPFFPKPRPFDFSYLSGTSNQDILLYQSEDKFGIILPVASLELRLKYQLKNPLFKLANSTFFKNDLLVIFSPSKTVMLVLIDSISRPRAMTEIVLSDDSQEQHIMLSSLHSLAFMNQQSGAQVTIQFDYQSLIQHESRLFLPLFHYSIYDNPKFNFFVFLSNTVFEVFWNGEIFSEYFLCIFLRDFLNKLPHKQKVFFVLNASTFCPSFHFLRELSLFAPYENQDSGLSKELKTYQCSTWFDLKKRDNDLFIESFLINENNTTSIYDIILNQLLSFDIDCFIPQEFLIISLLQMTSLFLSIYDKEIERISSFSNNIKDLVLIQKTTKVVNDICSKSTSEFWQAHNIITQNLKINVEPVTMLPLVVTETDYQDSWWQMRCKTKVVRTTVEKIGTSIYDALSDVIDGAQESAQSQIIAFCKSFIFNDI